MGSGKSTVSRWFRDWGAALVKGDALGWETLRDPEVVRGLAGAFGPGLLDASGAVDRGWLGKRVFVDDEAMQLLNRIVQPALITRVRDVMASSAAKTTVLDAAMVTTWGLESELDGVVEVRSSEEVRTRRLMAARGCSRAEALERIRGQQLPPVAGARRHWILDNDGELAALRRAAEAVWSEISALP